VLLVMAEEIGHLSARGLLGPAADAGVALLAPLATLATVEETVVRDKAVESACAVIRALDGALVAEHVVPVVQRLTTGDWFTGRVSACGLFAAAYSRLGASAAEHAEPKKLLRHLYGTLCGDDTPMVRRAASRHIGGLVAAVEKEFAVADLLPLFVQLAGDDPDSVRLLAIENCTAFARAFTQAENAAHILPLVRSCAGDKSWRVRNNVAREFFPLSEAMGAEATRGELLPLFVKLLQDPEGEVRASAARNVAGYAQLVGFERFSSDILPAMREAVGGAGAPSGDLAQSVRAALAEGLVSVAAAVGAAGAADAAGGEALHASVMPLIMQFLRDDSPDVKLRTLEGLPRVVGGVGARFLQESVLPQLLALGNDPLWRVRERVIAQLPLLAEQLGAQVFEERLLELYLGTYGDQVNAVRMAATRCLEPLARVLGAAWVRASIVPRLTELYRAKDSSYLQRITVLYAVHNLSVRQLGGGAGAGGGTAAAAAAAARAGGAGAGAGAGGGAAAAFGAGAPAPVSAAPVDLREVAEDLLGLLLEAPRDPVPNVRFVSMQVLAEAVRSGAYDRATVAKNILPVVTACLAADSDTDVRFFAAEAERAISGS